jgi:hypothetical protein
MLSAARSGLTEGPSFVEKEVPEKEDELNDSYKSGYASSVAHWSLDSVAGQTDSTFS